MYCWNCGGEIPDQSLYCPKCGIKISQDELIQNESWNREKPGKSNFYSRNIGILKIFCIVIAVIVIGSQIVGFTFGLLGLQASDAINTNDLGTADRYDTGQTPQITTTPTYVQTSTKPLPTRTATPKPTYTPTPRPTDTYNYYYRGFEWSYAGTDWTYTVGLPKDAYNYYRNKAHNRESDYAQYALSDYDRGHLKSIIEKFNEAGRKEGYGELDEVMMVVSFVQSLPYTSDSATTGYDEYPRYPLETLVDNGGDCEDTAILTAALLREMGYGAVLIELPGHMAVGVKCSDDFYGTYYEYQGSRYYYLETTGENWDIGELPSEYEHYSSATIHPMIQIPRMDFTFNAELDSYDYYYDYYRVRCDIENIGSGTAYNPVLYISALAPTEGSGMVWDEEFIELDNYEEGACGWAEATLVIPRYSISRINCMLYGSNFEPVEISSDQFTT